jgi:hypothetical protein
MPLAAADNSVCTTVGKYCAFYSPSHRILRLRDQHGWLRRPRLCVLQDGPAAAVGADGQYRGVDLHRSKPSWQCCRGHPDPRLRPDDGARPIPLSVIGHRSHLHRHAGSRLHHFDGGDPTSRVTKKFDGCTLLMPSTRLGEPAGHGTSFHVVSRADYLHFASSAQFLGLVRFPAAPLNASRSWAQKYRTQPCFVAPDPEVQPA